MNFELRRATADDLPGIAALFQHCFGLERSNTHWRWLYEEPPRRPSNRLALVITRSDDHSIQGHIGGIPLGFIARGEHYSAIQQVDLMVARAASRVDPTLAARLLAGVGEVLAPGAFELSLSFPRRGIIRRHHVALGMLEIARLGWHSIDLVQRRRATRPQRRFGTELLPITSFAGWADELWASWAPGVSAAIVRQARDLEWRYLQCPHTNYLCLQLRDRLVGIARGWAIVGRTTTSWEVVDMLAPSPWLETLLAHLERAAHADGAQRLRLRSLPDSPLAQRLLAADYRYERDLLTPMVQRYSPYVPLDAVRATYLLAGDSDQA
jgi:hypothetical protein